jgi:hypothetical protein
MREMPGWLRLLSALSVVLPWLTFTAGSAQPVESRATFHHLHLVSGEPDQLADFYDRLFVRGAVTRAKFWDIEGIRGSGVFLLVSGNLGGRPRATPTGLWHFGWGTGTVRESLNQTYAEHYATDVNWRPPYETLVKGFHVHLRSSDPVAAGEWYANVLGGQIDRPPRNEDSRRDDPDRRDLIPTDITTEPPRLAVSFGDIVLYFHQADEPLVSTRDAGLADHLAFAVKDMPSVLLRVPHENGSAASSATASAEHAFGLKDQRVVMIPGPDKVMIELIPLPKGPGFWNDRP